MKKNIFTGIGIGFIFLVLSVSLASASLSSSIYEGWSMNEFSGNAIDVLGIYNLTQFGTVPNQTGIYHGARGSFSSTSNYFKSTTANSLSYTNSYTFSFWIYRTGSWTYDTFLDTGAVTNDFRVEFLGQGTNIIHYYVSKDAAVAYANIAGNISIPLNTWTNVIGIWYSNGTMQLYINGQDAGRADNTVAAMTSTASINIGREYNGNNNAANTYIDEFYIFNTSITPSDVIQLSNSNSTLAFYPFIPLDSISGNISYNNVAFANASVQLMNSSGGFLAQSLSNSSGGYSFSSLSNATLYKVFAWFDNSTSDVSKNYFKVGEVYTTQSSNTLNLDFASVVSGVKTCQFSGSGISLSTITGCT